MNGELSLMLRAWRRACLKQTEVCRVVVREGFLKKAGPDELLRDEFLSP